MIYSANFVHVLPTAHRSTWQVTVSILSTLSKLQVKSTLTLNLRLKWKKQAFITHTPFYSWALEKFRTGHHSRVFAAREPQVGQGGL